MGVVVNELYVVGLQEGGGCYLCTGRFYTTRELAQTELDRDRAIGIKSSRIFTLRCADAEAKKIQAESAGQGNQANQPPQTVRA